MGMGMSVSTKSTTANTWTDCGGGRASSPPPRWVSFLSSSVPPSPLSPLKQTAVATVEIAATAAVEVGVEEVLEGGREGAHGAAAGGARRAGAAGLAASRTCASNETVLSTVECRCRTAWRRPSRVLNIGCLRHLFSLCRSMIDDDRWPSNRHE